MASKWSSANPLNWYYDNYVSTNTKTASSAGATAWNNVAYSKVKFEFSSGSKIYVTEINDSTVSWDGFSNFSYDSTTKLRTSGIITYNSFYTVTFNNSNALKSVATHEFGHAIGLGDNGTNKCIMNRYTWGTNSRYGTYGYTTPQTDDINGIKALYP